MSQGRMPLGHQFFGGETGLPERPSRIQIVSRADWRKPAGSSATAKGQPFRGTGSLVSPRLAAVFSGGDPNFSDYFLNSPKAVTSQMPF